VSDATPVVDNQEMLRAYAETIRLKDAEIERLKKSLEWWEETGRIKTAEIERLNTEILDLLNLIDKLRKGAE